MRIKLLLLEMEDGRLKEKEKLKVVKELELKKILNLLKAKIIIMESISHSDSHRVLSIISNKLCRNHIFRILTHLYSKLRGAS